MTKTFRERFREFFGGDSAPPPINEDSSLHQISEQYPGVYEFLERKYGVKAEPEDKGLTLRAFVEKFGLPPSQILFMEVQMSVRADVVRQLPATEVKRFLTDRPEAKLLDVREDWELKWGLLPGATPFTTELLDELLTSTPKEHPIVLYCHFGVRSLDAAIFLTDRGFTDVTVIKGGIDAWSQDVDPSLPRYEAAYC